MAETTGHKQWSVLQPLVYISASVFKLVLLHVRHTLEWLFHNTFISRSILQSL